MIMQHQQQQQQQCGNHWVDYQGNNVQPNYYTPNVINPQTTASNQDNAYRTVVYQGNYTGGPENGCEHFYYQTQPHIYDNRLNTVNNNQYNQMMNNFVNQNEIVNNSRCFSAEEVNIHKRKFDSVEEKDEILEDDEDQSPTIIPIDNENSRDAKRVKTSLSSVLANLQVSDTKPSSTCTQLMCYNENTNQTPFKLSSSNQPTLIDESVNEVLRKKLLSSIMNQTNRTCISDPRTDLILQSTKEEENDNQTAVVLYRDVIGRDEVLRLLGQQNDTSQTNQMSDE